MVREFRSADTFHGIFTFACGRYREAILDPFGVVWTPFIRQRMRELDVPLARSSVAAVLVAARVALLGEGVTGTEREAQLAGAANNSVAAHRALLSLRPLVVDSIARINAAGQWLTRFLPQHFPSADDDFSRGETHSLLKKSALSAARSASPPSNSPLSYADSLRRELTARGPFQLASVADPGRCVGWRRSASSHRLEVALFPCLAFEDNFNVTAFHAADVSTVWRAWQGLIVAVGHVFPACLEIPTKRIYRQKLYCDVAQDEVCSSLSSSAPSRCFFSLLQLFLVVFSLFFSFLSLFFSVFLSVHLLVLFFDFFGHLFRSIFCRLPHFLVLHRR